MKTNKPFSFQSRIKSFAYAFSGWRTLISNEPNALIHLFSAIVAVSLGFYFKISRTEWIAIVLCVVLVLGGELFNSALEVLCDLVEPDKHPQIKKIKDLAAGAVLVFAVGALIVGLVIFIPKML